jgi:glutamine synthetase
MTPKQVVEFAKENGVLMVDFKFMDFVEIGRASCRERV